MTGVITLIEDFTEIETKREYNEMMTTNIELTHNRNEGIKKEYDSVLVPLRNILTISLQKEDKSSKAITTEAESAIEHLQKIHVCWLESKLAVDELQKGVHRKNGDNDFSFDCKK